VVDDKLIIVYGEDDLVVSKPLSSPYIETAEEALETSFQALEIVRMMYVEPPRVNPCLSNASLIMAKFMLKEGYECGQGLGTNGQGSVHPLKLIENKGRYGLGYKPTWENQKKMIEEKKERNIAKLKGYKLKEKGITLCDIKQTFQSFGWINFDQVAMTEEMLEDEELSLMHPCLPNAQINNWEFKDLPMVYTTEEM